MADLAAEIRGKAECLPADGADVVRRARQHALQAADLGYTAHRSRSDTAP